MYKLQHIFDEYKIPATVVRETIGPQITTYEIMLHSGARKLSITRVISEIGVRLEAVGTPRLTETSGENTYTLEVANKEIGEVTLKSMLQSNEFNNSKKRFKFAVGETPYGKKIIGDLNSFKHLLVAGTTGSGKSVWINSFLLSSIDSESSDDLKMILIDPKLVELSPYSEIPHLLCPVITDPDSATIAMDYLLEVLQKRSEMLVKLAKSFNRRSFSNIDEYNDAVDNLCKEVKWQGVPKEKWQSLERKYKEMCENPNVTKDTINELKKIKEEAQRNDIPPSMLDEINKQVAKAQSNKIPHILLVVDEFANLIARGGKVLEDKIQQIIALGRSSGIHLVVATQRPSVDVISAVIRDNFPTRIAFKIKTRGGSTTILGHSGAENLRGKGDMIYQLEDGTECRAQGCFISSEKRDMILDNFVATHGKPVFDKVLMKMLKDGGSNNTNKILPCYQPLIDDVNRRMGVVNENVRSDDLEFMYVMDEFIDDFWEGEKEE